MSYYRRDGYESWESKAEKKKEEKRVMNNLKSFLRVFPEGGFTGEILSLNGFEDPIIMNGERSRGIYLGKEKGKYQEKLLSGDWDSQNGESTKILVSMLEGGFLDEYCQLFREHGEKVLPTHSDFFDSRRVRLIVLRKLYEPYQVSEEVSEIRGELRKELHKRFPELTTMFLHDIHSEIEGVNSSNFYWRHPLFSAMKRGDEEKLGMYMESINLKSLIAIRGLNGNRENDESVRNLYEISMDSGGFSQLIEPLMTAENLYSFGQRYRNKEIIDFCENELGLNVDSKVIQKYFVDWEHSYLHEAIISRDIKRVEWLVERGASLEEMDKDGRTPFLLACRMKNNEAMRLLQEAGANIQEKDRYGMGPVHLAVSKISSMSYDVKERINYPKTMKDWEAQEDATVATLNLLKECGFSLSSPCEGVARKSAKNPSKFDVLPKTKDSYALKKGECIREYIDRLASENIVKVPDCECGMNSMDMFGKLKTRILDNDLSFDLMKSLQELNKEDGAEDFFDIDMPPMEKPKQNIKVRF